MMRKKAEAELTKECKKEKGDKFVKQTYARQVQQAIKHKDKYTENKYKIKNLEYGLDTYFGKRRLIIKENCLKYLYSTDCYNQLKKKDNKVLKRCYYPNNIVKDE